MKTLQYLSANETIKGLVKTLSWKDIAKGEYKIHKDAGIPIRILHGNGSFKVIANGENIPEGIETRFKAEPKIVTWQTAEETATALA